MVPQLFVLIFLGLIVQVECEKFPYAKVDWMAEGESELKEALKVTNNVKKAKNVILFIGDGMGMPSITAGRILKGQMAGRAGEEEKLAFETFPHIGLSKIYNVNHQVPVSGSCATAMLSGEKINFYTVGVNQEVEYDVALGYGKNADITEGDITKAQSVAGNEVWSMLELSHQEGKSTGIVTTTRVTHATPAATYAHLNSRWWEYKVPDNLNGVVDDVATQLIRDHPYINVILGGGRRNFMLDSQSDPEYPNSMGRRTDADLIQEWLDTRAESSDTNYKYVYNQQQFDDISPADTDYLLGLFEPSHMKYESVRSKEAADTSISDDKKELSLTEMTKKAIEILQKNDKGYFLMVEGGRVDHAHHAGYALQALTEVVSFSKAVEDAIKMVNTDDTLIVVTADHGHTLSIGGYPGRGNSITGVQDNEEEPPQDGLPYLTLMYANGPGGSLGRRDLTNVDTSSIDFQQSALVPLASETHDGSDVPIYATGPWAHLFHTTHEQNYVAHVMGYASCVPPFVPDPLPEHCGGDAPPVQDCNSAGRTQVKTITLLLCSILTINFAIHII